MSSYYFKIEVYGEDNYGCPDFGLMGYNNINELVNDCWKEIDELYPQEANKTNAKPKQDGYNSSYTQEVQNGSN